jgi:hypothetical protein
MGCLPSLVVPFWSLAAVIAGGGPFLTPMLNTSSAQTDLDSLQPRSRACAAPCSVPTKAPLTPRTASSTNWGRLMDGALELALLDERFHFNDVRAKPATDDVDERRQHEAGAHHDGGDAVNLLRPVRGARNRADRATRPETLMNDRTVCRGCGQNLREGSNHEADCLASKLEAVDQYNGRLVATNRELVAQRDDALGRLNAIRKLIGTPMTAEDAFGKGGREAVIGKTHPPKPVDRPGAVVAERCDNTPCALDAGHEGMCSSFRPPNK